MNMMIASLAALVLAAAQPADEGPIGTAVKPPVLVGPPAAAAKPASKASPPAPSPSKATSLEFDPKTKVDGETLQVILGERAVFRIDSGGYPVLATTETGKLTAAHPAGAVSETFAAPGPGRLAAALDGSAEKRASVLKVWNGLDYPVDYRAVVLVARKGQTLTPMPVAVCAVKPGETRTESWPAPVVAVGLARFKRAGVDARPACK
jgi:hypothetical protein